ncbi:MAG: hypothetical protein KA248_10075 [Kiritimatiellae bacterium]|nr:hypothetical protein [Kiritimatiellia bacterium]
MPMRIKRCTFWMAAAATLFRALAVWGQADLEITNFGVVSSGLVRLDGRAPVGERCIVQYTADPRQPFADIADSTRTARVDGAVGWTVDAGAMPRAFFRMRRSRSLLTWADLEAGFAGTFGVPLAESGDYRFSYSSGVHAQLTNGNLLVVGHPYYDRQAQVQLPAILDGREGTLVGGWTDITGGLVPDGWGGGELGDLQVGGLLPLEGRIRFTKYQWYNAASVDWQTQGYYEGVVGGSGTASGLWSVSNEYAHHSCVGGYLSEAPQALRDAGYAYLSGLEGISSGGALGRWGPNLFAINSAVTNGRVRAATLIYHPDEARQGPTVRCSNATSAWWVANRPANETWWVGNKATDMKWIETETRHGVLCFVYRGLGQTWYGLGNAGPGYPDPYWQGNSYHAEGYALQAFIYDPDEVMEVYRGERDPWNLVPAEAVLLTERLPGSATETHYSFFTGLPIAEVKASVRGNRLVLLQADTHYINEWESTPKGYVLSLP